jgi:hypothetical protein
MGWLGDLTNWFREQILSVWNALSAWAHDLGIWVLKSCTEIALAIANAIPVPDFLSSISFGTLFASLPGDWLPWIVGKFHFGACFAVLGAGVLFRLLRKLFTLGQW